MIQLPSSQHSYNAPIIKWSKAYRGIIDNPHTARQRNTAVIPTESQGLYTDRAGDDEETSGGVDGDVARRGDVVGHQLDRIARKHARRGHLCRESRARLRERMRQRQAGEEQNGGESHRKSFSSPLVSAIWHEHNVTVSLGSRLLYNLFHTFARPAPCSYIGVKKVRSEKVPFAAPPARLCF